MVGRSSDRAHRIRRLIWDVGPIQSKREHVFVGVVWRRYTVIWWGHSDTGGKRNPELWKVKKLEEEN